MFKRKIKTVSFRLSAADYAVFQQACEPYGFSTVSEFARRAMQSFIDNGTSAEHTREIQDLQAQVQSLAGEVTRLAETLKAAPTAGVTMALTNRI